MFRAVQRCFLVFMWDEIALIEAANRVPSYRGQRFTTEEMSGQVVHNLGDFHAHHYSVHVCMDVTRFPEMEVPPNHLF